MHDLKQLVRLVKNCRTKYMKFDLDYDLVVVISSETAWTSTADVLKEHAVPAMVSSDLLYLLQDGQEE